MRRQKSKSQQKLASSARPKPRVRTPSQRASELMELATIAAQSRDLRAFLKLFSQRVARMLSAQWCGVVVIRGQEADLESGSDERLSGLNKNNIVMHALQASRATGIYIARQLQAGAASDAGLIVVPVYASDG